MNDVPLGLLFSIAENESALEYYANLSVDTKNDITKFVQTDMSMDAKERIDFVVSSLERNDISFL